MKGQNYYLVTALPALGKLGSEPPMLPPRLLEHLAEAPTALEAVEALLLGDDLIQREALLSGETDKPAPNVLTEAQVRDEHPLPDYLNPEPGSELPRQIAADVVWEAYFRHAASVARRTRNAFLAEWVAFEVALRNALATRRAETLRLDPKDYVLASDLTDEAEDFSLVIGEWSAADNPLGALRVLDRTRWDWIAAHERWFSFADDELAAYAAKLMLLERWDRLERDTKDKSNEQKTLTEP